MSCVEYMLFPLVLVCQGAGWSYDPPPAFLKMAEARAALKTGAVDVAFEEFFGQRRVFENRTYRFAGSDLLYVGRGDDQGVVWRDTDGNPTPYAHDLAYALRKGDQLWVHRELDYEAEFKPAKSHHIAPDVRTIGLMYGFTYGALEEAIWRDPVKQPGARKYSETVDEGMHVVTAQSDVGEIKWWIDPQRGWQPVRVALFVDGQLFAESRSVLKQFDGAWFPEAVQYWVKGHAEGREPKIRITVHSGEFNRPDHPHEFRPEEIGILPAVTTSSSRSTDWTVSNRRKPGPSAVSASRAVGAMSQGSRTALLARRSFLTSSARPRTPKRKRRGGRWKGK